MGKAVSLFTLTTAIIITVLTRGQVLAQGHYSELTKDERVKEAYLGAGHA